jgi:hypothetical protein
MLLSPSSLLFALLSLFFSLRGFCLLLHATAGKESPKADVGCLEMNDTWWDKRSYEKTALANSASLAGHN